MYKLTYFLLCWFGGTNPKPEAPTTTPELSSGASGGDCGKTTGPTKVERICGLISSMHKHHMFVVNLN